MNYILLSIFLLLSPCILIYCQDRPDNPPIIETPNEIDYLHEIVVDSLDIPWGMDFISENELLITEKKGELIYAVDGSKTQITNLPNVYVRGQGGLLDVALHPEYEVNNIIYLVASTNTEEDDKGGNTALYSAVLNLQDFQLDDLTLLYKATPNTNKGQHWGSRIVFDDQGYLYFAIGDRGQRDITPQDLSTDGGKIYRLNLDGTIPSDNPFVGEPGVKEAIFSYGHRNPQGMIFHPEKKQLWLNEHGPRGGDEINISLKGRNYGWPEITYGINYSGTIITNQTHKEGMEQPFYYWTPSIGPSGMAILTSDIYPQWKGNIFVGSLRFEYLERLVIEDDKVVKREKILDKIGRVRNVVEGPDGYLYVGVENLGIVRIIPKNETISLGL
ncbi:MAG: PQQ-dependent sugar dehydrogenase [Flavobacteriaceae bacterium]|nr:PQQ-dependent sugar dehydrogenase [Flavobacteriaceae bacterium]